MPVSPGGGVCIVGRCRFKPAVFLIAELSLRGASCLPAMWGPQPPGLVLSDALLELSCRAWLLPCLPRSTLDLLRREGQGGEENCQDY